MAGILVADTLQDGAGNSTAMDNAIYGSAKAWVNFTSVSGGSATITAAYNVSSVVQNSTANYTVNFTNALADNKYAWCGSAGVAQSANQTPWVSAPANTALATWKQASLLNFVGIYGNITSNSDTANGNYSIIVLR